MEMPIMECGHTAMAIDGDKNPCCVICHGDPKSKTVAKPPDLKGRLAKCYCGNTRESSIELAFFEYKGPDSHASKNMCKLCGYALMAHWPKWEYQILMVRDWFKHKKMKDDETRKEHMPNKEAVEYYANRRIEELLKNYTSTISKDTTVYEAKIEYIKGPLSSGRGHEFAPHGTFEHDVFYCGCQGWD